MAIPLKTSLESSVKQVWIAERLGRYELDTSLGVSQALLTMVERCSSAVSVSLPREVGVSVWSCVRDINASVDLDNAPDMRASKC